MHDEDGSQKSKDVSGVGGYEVGALALVYTGKQISDKSKIIFLRKNRRT